jgi:hypothetical protein
LVIEIEGPSYGFRSTMLDPPSSDLSSESLKFLYPT